MSKEVRRISLGEGQPDIIVEEKYNGDFIVKQPVYIDDFGYASRNVTDKDLESKIEQVKKNHPYTIASGNEVTLEIP